MSVIMNTHCANCFRRRDGYAIYTKYTIWHLGKEKKKSKKNPPPDHDYSGSSGLNLKLGESPGSGQIPETWICGRCRHGPMNINIDTHCQYCGVRRDVYASSDFGTKTGLGPGVVDGLKSDGEKIKELNKEKTPPHHWKYSGWPGLNLERGECSGLTLERGGSPSLKLEFSWSDLEHGELQALNLQSGESPGLNLEHGELLADVETGEFL